MPSKRRLSGYLLPTFCEVSTRPACPFRLRAPARADARLSPNLQVRFKNIISMIHKSVSKLHIFLLSVENPSRIDQAYTPGRNIRKCTQNVPASPALPRRIVPGLAAPSGPSRKATHNLSPDSCITISLPCTDDTSYIGNVLNYQMHLRRSQTTSLRSQLPENEWAQRVPAPLYRLHASTAPQDNVSSP
ncbi:hypothetical protein BD779DRAFT_602626 [Infundibulicybe gibba]|nr:hypothetical protein BD779DRAFT_602626 [Infundibulicybe gibba]